MEQAKVYLILDKISPALRSLLSGLLITTGFLFQVSTRNILTGLPFIIACLILNFIKGISIKAVQASQLNWQEVTPEKIDQVITHCEKVKGLYKTDWGCLLLIAFVATIFLFLEPVGEFLFKRSKEQFPIVVTVVDLVILFTGLILSGSRTVWIPPGLAIKAEIVKRMVNSPSIKKDVSLKAIPYLEIGKTKKGSFPNDTRFLIKFIDAPQEFIGLQGQISINTVKSTDYPYFYVVLIAKPEFNLFEKFGKPVLKDITIEKKKTGEVDVIVIRQTTTKTSGYHTNNRTQDYILSNGINLAKSVLRKSI